MSLSDIETVFNFLRTNGLSASESAFMEDIIEKSQLSGDVNFQSFLFSDVTPPPPQLTTCSPVNGDHVSDHSSDDEFVSVDSSTTDLYPSDFTNPYAIRTVGVASSQASSDRLSQFGTARGDFDMQNDLNWYKDRQEDSDSVPPCLDNFDFYGGPSEDKFVMTQTKNLIDNSLDFEHESDIFQSIRKDKHANKLWCSKSVEDAVEVKDYYDLDEHRYRGDGTKIEKNSCPDHAFHGNDKNNYFDHREDSEIQSLVDFKESIFNFKGTGNGSNECVLAMDHETNRSSIFGDFKGTSIFHHQLNEKCSHEGIKCDYEVEDDNKVNQDSCENDAAVNEGGNAIDDELIYSSNEEDFEVFSLRIIHRKNRTGFEENKDFPIVMNTMIAGRYYITEYLGSAAFSKVVQAHDLLMGVDVCLKIIKNDKDFFDQSLDEIKLLKYVNKHDPGDERHILRLYDYFYHQEHLFIVCELLRANLYEFQKFNRESGGEPYFTMNRLQVITRQCLEALIYLHDLGIIHCDLKPENILIKSYRKCEIKVIDLGSSCFQNDNLSLYVQSRSYRAPEVILGNSYDQKIDLWSLGCILAELYSGEVLFPNEPIVMLLGRMIGILGPIDMEMLATGQDTEKYFTKEYDLYHINEDTNQMEYIIPEETSLEDDLQISDVGLANFLRDLLEINPLRRLTAREALDHPWLSYSYDSHES